jgi:hypothetical protein
MIEVDPVTLNALAFMLLVIGGLIAILIAGGVYMMIRFFGHLMRQMEDD